MIYTVSWLRIEANDIILGSSDQLYSEEEVNKAVELIAHLDEVERLAKELDI